MRMEFNSRRLFGITRSAGKMYEFGVPENLRINIQSSDQLLQLFLLTIGILGDVSAYLATASNPLDPLPSDLQAELNFSASYFDAIIESRFAVELERPTMLMGAAAYYLARRPGSSLVLARRIGLDESVSNVEKLLVWVLQANWRKYLSLPDLRFGDELSSLSKDIAFHFHDGSGVSAIIATIERIQQAAYNVGSARELLYVDLIAAICRMRLASSAWTNLPEFSVLPKETWASVIRGAGFPKELWPSQMLLGKSGLFSGASALIQMPTSAGKTRSVEIILRSAFMANRTKLAIVVAPFRALCHEIAISLRHDFQGDDVKVNELSDALQIDFMNQVAELFGGVPPLTAYVLVLTPEKLLYVLRQSPDALRHIGLVVYDEGHQFDTGNRGITYELLLAQIKQLLPSSAQTVLISAVMQNPKAISGWLLGEERAQVVDGTTLLPTSRAVAFASWGETLGQLIFFENGVYRQYDYFVPRVIGSVDLPDLDDGGKFPQHQKTNDIALYLGLRAVKNGAVAVFCGTKLVASGIAKRAVQIHEAGYQATWPSAFSNEVEVAALDKLIAGNFGVKSFQSRAAKLGVFTHHGNTPHGLRLALEYAMQRGLIGFVACTSTLAQGVNLPIRYLIVTSVYQGDGRVKVRDFQNLIGRAGRSGMHTEGVVLFADSSVYDKRRTDSWKFDNAVELLSPDRAEGVTSSLLLLLAPFALHRNWEVRVQAGELLQLLDVESSWEAWVDSILAQFPKLEKQKQARLAKSIRKSLRERKKMVHTVESYLMANRTSSDDDGFVADAIQLARETLAFSLASQSERENLESLFGLIAQRVQAVETLPAKHAAFGKTLLGVKEAKYVEQWVFQNRDHLLSLDTNELWLAAVWPIFANISDSKFFRAVEPVQVGVDLAREWINGKPYFEIFKHAEELKAKKQAGKRRMKVSDDDVLDFLESTLAFDCALVLAAVAQFLFESNQILNPEATALGVFQKSLKYGLPDNLSVSIFEAGYSDRQVAQEMRDALLHAGFDGPYFEAAKRDYLKVVDGVIGSLPAYFSQVMKS